MYLGSSNVYMPSRLLMEFWLASGCVWLYEFVVKTCAVLCLY